MTDVQPDYIKRYNGKTPKLPRYPGVPKMERGLAIMWCFMWSVNGCDGWHVSGYTSKKQARGARKANIDNHTACTPIKPYRMPLL